MKNNKYLLILLISTLSFSQINDTLAKIDSIKVNRLKEVKIAKKQDKAGVYQLIMPKKILENEVLSKTIKRIDFITLDNSENLLFKGKKINTILLNDKVISIEEFNKLTIESVRSISINSNYFNQKTGEIESAIKIVERNNIYNNIKGSADLSYGFFQKFNYYRIDLSNKQNKLSSRLLISNLNNDTENSVYQICNDKYITIENKRELQQPYFSLQNIYEIDDKSAIYIKNRYAIVDENKLSDFSDLSKIDYQYKIKNYSLNIGYDKKFENNYTFKLNLDYINKNDIVNSNYNISKELDFSEQKFQEVTFSPFLQKKENKYELVNSFILTNRKYDFQNTVNSNKINQNIVTYFANLSFTIDDKKSLLIGGRYQLEKNDMTNKSNNYFLPNLTFLTQIDSTTSIEFNYKRKLQRPSINSISGSSYFDSNGVEIINPAFLLTQIDNFLSIDSHLDFKKMALNVSLNYDFSKEYISSLYGFKNNDITNTAINVDHYYEASIFASCAVQLWKDSKLNINYSFTKLQFEEGNNKINGLKNYYDLSLSGSVFKDYLYTISSFYIDRYYEYNVFFKSKPDFSVSLSKNYLKDKLNVNLEFRNILNKESNREISFVESSNFYFQNSINQSRLLLVAMTYNFGKNFKMVRKNIQNSNADIKL